MDNLPSDGNPENVTWNILLIDDDEDDFLIVRDMLVEARGHECELRWATSYDEGWKELFSNPYDAVLVDYDLGLHSGIDLIRAAAGRGCEVPLILYTGRGTYEVDLEAMQAGATLYLTKGDTKALLLERAIRYAIERKQAEERIRRQNAVLESINDIFREALTCRTEQELGEVCLAEAQKVSGSKLSFIGEINAVGLFGNIAVNNAGWTAWVVTPPDMQGKIPFGMKIHGIYGRVLRDGVSVLTNDPPSHPDSIGLPQGHPPLNSFLGVPLVYGGRTFGMVGLANREGGFRECEREAVEALSVAIAQAIIHFRTEQAVRKSEERFRIVQDHSPDGFTILRPVRDEMGKVIDFTWVYENQAIALLSGTDPKTIVGQRLLELFPGHRDTLLFAAYRKVAETGEPSVLEAPYQGETITTLTWFRLAVVPMGEDIAILAQDMTGRRQAAEALRESEERYRALIQASSNAVYRMSPDWGEMRFLVGRDFIPDMVEPSRSWLQKYIYPEDQARVQAAIDEAIRAKSTFELEHRVLRVDGSPGWIFSRAIPMLDDRGRISEWFGMADDITQRRQAEEALLEAAEKLEYSNRELERFAFSASHDLQEPLRKIKQFGGLLEQKLTQKVGKEVRDTLQRMIKASERMQSMIDDLLELSRVSTQGQAFELVELTRVAAEVVSDLEPRLRETGGRVLVEKLPRVEADPIQMQLLFQNLIGNALKFHRKDAPPLVKVRGEVVRVREGSDQVSVRIEDNGIGFDEGKFAEMLQPFHRLHERADFDGAGMGLAIVKRIVERHRGEISARSKPGEGSVFTITLPRGQVSRG